MEFDSKDTILTCLRFRLRIEHFNGYEWAMRISTVSESNVG